MAPYRPVTAAGQRALDVVLGCPDAVQLVLDYDGVLAPAPQRGADAKPDPRAAGLLTALARRLGGVAILSARDAASVVRLVGLQPSPDPGVSVLGQHGLERWDCHDGTLSVPPAPASFPDIIRELPWLLRELGRPGNFERRGSTVVIPLRQFIDPEAAAADLRGGVTELAHRHGLNAELTPQAWEIRPARADKGRALRDLVTTTGGRIVVYAGDNRADLPVFESVDDLRRSGIGVIVLYAGDDSDTLLLSFSDVFCDGPDGVMA